LAWARATARARPLAASVWPRSEAGMSGFDRLGRGR
jgi:hypothetical protein